MEYTAPQALDPRGHGPGKQGAVGGGPQGPCGAVEQPQLPLAHIQAKGAEKDQGKKGKQPVHQAAQPGQTLPQRPEQMKQEGQEQSQGHGGQEASGLRPGAPHPPQSLRKKPPAGRSSS